VVADGWEAYERLADKLRAEWPPSRTTHDTLDELRR
jgi:hypothetical protein